MKMKHTTQVPNELFDTHLKHLTPSELKLILIILRQTYGWINKATGTRKTRDRISHSQFITKTGLSRRVISKALSSLQSKNLIAITNHQGNPLTSSEERKGKTCLYYSYSTCASPNSILRTKRQNPVQKNTYNKTNTTKETTSKLTKNPVQKVSDILESYPRFE